MNILIIGVDSSKYGSPMSMAVLAKHLNAFGHRVLCVIPEKGSIEQVLQDSGVAYRIIKIKKWIYLPQNRLVNILMRLYRFVVNCVSEVKLLLLCKKNKIDIIHLNSSAACCGYLCSRILKTKLIWHVREFVEEDFGYLFYNKAKAMQKMNRADAVITISKALYRKYADCIDEGRLKLIYNGIESESYGSNAGIWQGTRPVVAHIGRLGENKGQAELIEACLQYKRNKGVLDFDVWMVGDGKAEYLETLKQKAEELGGNIHFKGFCDNVGKLLSQVDVVVVNSKCEAFGRVTVEAMLAGRLVVGTNTGGTPEILGDCGLLYEYGNAAKLAELLAYALEHRAEMQQSAMRGKSRAERMFTAERNAREVNDLYRNLEK